jgi:hypothetical protein
MAEDLPPYHTIEDDPDLVRPYEPRGGRKTGKGGSRHGFVAENEIEDMTIFDTDFGKEPSKDHLDDPKSIDAGGFRKPK